MLLTRRPPPTLAAMTVGRPHHQRLAPARYMPSPPPRQGSLESMGKGEEERARGLELLPMQSRTLDHADACLAEYCSTAPTPEAREQCLEVLRYYREKRAAAERGCILDLQQQQQQQQQGASSPANAADAAAAASPACASLSSLSRMLWDTSYSDPSALYHVLRTQRAIELAPHTAANDADAANDNADAANKNADALRARALRLFHLADSDSDGQLDREEFLNSMRLMDAELTDAELGCVFSALDASCSLSAEQFVDAVTGESLLAAALGRASVDSDSECDDEGRVTRHGVAFLRRHVRAGGGIGAPGKGAGPAALSRTAGAEGGGGACCDADVLRRVRHSRPTWWSDAPGYLEM